MVCYIVWSTIVGFFERVIFLAVKERHRRQVYVCGVLHCSTLSNWWTIKYIFYSEIKIVRLSTFRYIVEYNRLHALYSKYLFCLQDIIINDDMLRSSRIFVWYQIFGAIKIVCVTFQDSAPSVFILCSTWFPFRQTPPRPIYFYFPLLKYIIYCLDRENI